MTETLYEHLKATYEPNRPIFAKNVRFGNMSPANIRYQLAHLEDKGMIEKASPGIYYLPALDITGAKVRLSSDDIAYEKYIRPSGACMGFFSGATLANRIGLSTQVPCVKEICSNISPAPVREIKIQDSKYVLRKPPVAITEDNVNVLQFLDCLKNLERCADEPLKTCADTLTNFCHACRITRAMVNQYIGYYPQSVYAAIYWTEVEFYVSP